MADERCPTCGSTDVEVIAGHAAFRSRARAPRTMFCFGCGLIAEREKADSGELVWREVT